jgi:PleD family two-component response regulator
VAAHSFADADGARTQRITMSIGLSTFPRPAGDREALLRQADDALFIAKRSGRNRVNASPGIAAVTAPKSGTPAPQAAVAGED